MFLVLFTLIALNLVAMAVTGSMGATLDTADSVRTHFVWGLGTTILLCFTHLLVMFYLIGTEGDIKEALENEPDMAELYVPETKKLKWGVFPFASGAALLAIVAAVLGAEVHSRLLMKAPPTEAPPIRGEPFWWLHLVVVIVSVLFSLVAFWREGRAVIENRVRILQINAELDRRDEADRALGPAEVGSSGS